MSSEKISALPSHTLNSADIIPVANGGANYGDTVGQIETAAAALVHWSTLLGDLAETQVIPFDGGTPGTADTGISRLGPASLTIGNGTAGDTSGSLSCLVVNASSSVYINGGAGLYSSAGRIILSTTDGTGYAFSAGSNASAGADTNISRLGAASLAIGNGTAGNASGTLNLTNIKLGGVATYLSGGYAGGSIMAVGSTAGGADGAFLAETFYFNHNGGDDLWDGANSRFIFGNATYIGWANSTYGAGNSPDISISRASANVLQIGNTAGTPDARGTLDLKEIVLTDFGSVPHSSSGGGTAGTVGEIVQHSGVLYFCSSTGSAGSATWNVITMTLSA